MIIYDIHNIACTKIIQCLLSLLLENHFKPHTSAISSSKSSSGWSLMRDQLVHFIWLGTHFLRTLIDNRGADQLGSLLTEEVRVLQAELHRTQQVLEGYSLVVGRCENRIQLQNRGNQIFLLVIVVALCGLLISFCRGKVRPVQPPIFASAGTGGSSESDDSLDQKPAPIAPLKGPARPSLLGKGKRGRS